MELIEVIAKDAGLQKHFSDLLGPMMQVTVQSVEKQDDESCLKSLIDISEAMPKFLRPQLDQIFQLCLKESQKKSWNINNLLISIVKIINGC